jgi:UDP-GlcNAc:undecaprenyl-phosphate GlcNAc-1-phosphate transferase
MFMNFNGIEIAELAAALGLALILLVEAAPLANLLGVVDRPDNVRKKHLKETPLIGGIAIIVPLLFWSALHLTAPSDALLTLAVMTCGGGAALIGFLDDRSSMSPVARLFAMIALTLAALALDPDLVPAAFHWGHLEPSPVAPWAAFFLVAVGMTGYVNAVNMADGQDGCVAGMFVIWSSCIVLVGGHATAGLALVLLITSLAVLAFNLRGQVFLGGAGAYGVTFVFGLLILRLHNYWGVSAETVIVWFFVPIVDCLRLLVSRPLHGHSPFRADRNHFHHRLGERFGTHLGLAIYLSLVASTSFVAALKPDLAPACLGVLAVVYAGLMVATMPRLQTAATRHAAIKIAPRDH